jgi:phage-related minor tail protein
MANQILARLGVKMTADNAEFKQGMDEGVLAVQKFERAVKRELNAAEKEMRQLEYAAKDVGREVSNVEKMQRQLAQGGKFSRLAGTEEAQNLLFKAAALDKATQAQKANNAEVLKSVGLTMQQRAALGYQTTDIITSLAGGQNPMLVLLQQGGQLRDQFGGFKALFAGIAEAMTPIRVASLGLVAAIGGIAYAIYASDKALKEFNNTMALTGGYTSVTYDQYQKLSASLGTFANITISNAREIYGALLSSGQFTKDTIDSVAKAIAVYARVSGTTVKDSSDKLISAFDGSASSAAKLNEQMHFLTFEQYKQIEALERVGDKQAAVKIVANALTKALEEQGVKAGWLEGIWNGLRNTVTSFIDWFGSQSSAERLREMDKTLALMAMKIAKLVDNQKDATIALERYNQLLEHRNKLAGEIGDIEAASNEKASAAEKIRRQSELDRKYGGIEKANQLRYQLEDIIEETIFQRRLEGLNEFEKISAEATRRIAKANVERNRENAKEEGYNATKRLEIYQATITQIEQWEKSAQQAISDREFKTLKDRQLASRDELNSQIEKINLYKDNIFISEQDLNLQLAKLKAQQEIARISRTVGLSEAQRSQLIADEKSLLEKRLLVANSDASRSEVLRLKQRQISDQESLKVEEEKLRIYEKNLLISDADYRIEVSRLETAKKIAEIRQNEKIGDPGAREQLAQREEAMQQQREGIIQLSERLNVLRDVNRAVFQDMENAIVNFVKTGKLNFKALAQSIISDIMAIYIKAQFLQMFKGAGNIFSSMFGGGNSAAGSMGNFPASVPMAAAGGYIDGPTLVGENGPEIFMPRSAGTVIPNQRMNDFQSAPQVVYNGPYIAQMNAIDTQSATQFLSKNKQAVWAANQSASRGVPASRA